MTAVLIAFVAASCFALSSALHQKAAKQQPRGNPLNPGLLIRLARNRLWLTGWIPDTTGTILQVAALRLGPLAVVQPVMASGLFNAVLTEAALTRRKIAGRDLFAVATGMLGLAGFLVLADVQHGTTNPNPGRWTPVTVMAGLTLAVCLLAATRLTDTGRGVALGIGSGLAYSFAAALAKIVTSRYHGDPLEVILVWPTLLLVLTAGLGLLLNQSAFQHGRLAAPLTALTLTDPITSVIIGISVFEETIHLTPPRAIGLALAVAAIVAGICLAGTSTGSGQRR
ncbi:DMT family transporter [Polymorphospora rubra]|uniref:DMT family transporter n=1 Tax=Polymorphospora rubra TaxID=338584 RepID=UPI00340BE6A4